MDILVIGLLNGAVTSLIFLLPPSPLFIHTPGRYHMDILVIGLLNGACGLFGVPWVTACPVLSVAHASALTVMTTYHAPGEPPRVLEVYASRGWRGEREGGMKIWTGGLKGGRSEIREREREREDFAVRRILG